MPVRATTDKSVTLDVGDEWVIGVLVTDHDGQATEATVAVAVTTSAGGSANPTASADDTGYYRAYYTVAAAGRHIAQVTVSGDVIGVVTFTAWVGEATPASLMPDLSDVKTYLDDVSESDAQLQDVLDAEAAAQRARCSVPAVYPADLREALLRRVARNLAARRVPVAQFSSFEGGSTVTRVPMLDAEIVRFEAPYRRRRVG